MIASRALASFAALADGGRGVSCFICCVRAPFRLAWSAVRLLIPRGLGVLGSSSRSTRLRDSSRSPVSAVGPSSIILITFSASLLLLVLVADDETSLSGSSSTVALLKAFLTFWRTSGPRSDPGWDAPVKVNISCGGGAILLRGVLAPVELFRRGFFPPGLLPPGASSPRGFDPSWCCFPGTVSLGSVLIDYPLPPRG
ncbi:hypothetical protein BJX70DRAFT_385098 [Aspergillus crustosus]